MPKPIPDENQRLTLSRANQTSATIETRENPPIQDRAGPSGGAFAPSTQPTTGPAFAMKQAGEGLQKDVDRTDKETESASAAQTQAAGKAILQQNVIRARNLTRRQEMDLRANLSKAQ